MGPALLWGSVGWRVFGAAWGSLRVCPPLSPVWGAVSRFRPGHPFPTKVVLLVQPDTGGPARPRSMHVWWRALGGASARLLLFHRLRWLPSARVLRSPPLPPSFGCPFRSAVSSLPSPALSSLRALSGRPRPQRRRLLCSSVASPISPALTGFVIAGCISPSALSRVDLLPSLRRRGLLWPSPECLSCLPP